MEVWKDIQGYEGLYQISNMGNVKTLKRTTSYNRIIEEKIKSQREKYDGYLRVTLCKNGKKSTIAVHRLVAQTFIPNPINKPQVNHIDCNKKNNCVDNLEWADNFENMRHAWENGLLPEHVGRKGETCNFAKLTEQEAIEILEMSKSCKQKEIAKKYNIAVSTVSRIINGKRWGHLSGGGTK